MIGRKMIEVPGAQAPGPFSVLNKKQISGCNKLSF